MNLPLFTATIHCTSRKKCHLCQDKGKRGEQLRRVLATVYTMPGEGAYPCPFGETPPPPPPAKPVPTPEEQTAWLERVLPICQGCPAFGGMTTSEGKITHRIKCSKCKTCGSKTVSAVQNCPLGKWISGSRSRSDR